MGCFKVFGVYVVFNGYFFDVLVVDFELVEVLFVLLILCC